jgi:hypothetical protein
MPRVLLVNIVANSLVFIVRSAANYLEALAGNVRLFIGICTRNIPVWVPGPRKLLRTGRTSDPWN